MWRTVSSLACLSRRIVRNDTSIASPTTMTTERHAARYQQKTPAGCGCQRSQLIELEASGGFEPPIRVLQTPALPLGYDAMSPVRVHSTIDRGFWSRRVTWLFRPPATLPIDQKIRTVNREIFPAVCDANLTANSLLPICHTETMMFGISGGRGSGDSKGHVAIETAPASTDITDS